MNPAPIPGSSAIGFVQGYPRVVTDCRGFVSSALFGSFGKTTRCYRFVRGIDETLQIAVGSFRQRRSVRSGRSAIRYRLPWVRFVNAVRFVRGVRSDGTDCRGFVSSTPFGSFGEIGQTLQIAVGSFRQRRSVRSGSSVRRYRLPWVRFVNAVRFVRGVRSDGTDCRGFVSSTPFGSFGEFGQTVQIAVGSFRQRRSARSGRSVRRYRLRWVRFVSGFRFVRGVRSDVTDCRGFVSSTAGVDLANRATRVGSAEDCQISKDREEAFGCFLAPYYRAATAVDPAPLEDSAGSRGQVFLGRPLSRSDCLRAMPTRNVSERSSSRSPR